MKKTVWFEVAEDETISACLERMREIGYTPIARKEEPLFMEEKGGKIPVRQIIKFKGTLLER